MLPSLRDIAPCWAWEHGDPTPAFFSIDGDERKNIKQKKLQNCYPNIDGVITISEFIKSDIRWPNARIIYNGCDHVPDLGTKTLSQSNLNEPIRIGTLMRMGQGEANYKGNDLFLELIRAAEEGALAASFFVMGRGTEDDAAVFETAGATVFLNVPDSEKWKYLRDLDVFVSCSLWEGFNLPLVEAQACGTVSFAFDTGAHPEVTPFLVSNVEELMSVLTSLNANRSLLRDHSKAAYKFVRSRFSWAKTATLLLEIPGYSTRSPAACTLNKKTWFRIRSLFNVFVEVARKQGPKMATKKMLNYLRTKLFR